MTEVVRRSAAADAEAAANDAVKAAQLADRIARSIPKPNTWDGPAREAEYNAQRIAERSSMPRRNRWRGLLEIDKRINALHARQAELQGALAALDVRIADQREEDRRRLAAWVAQGERVERPEPLVPALEAERETASATLDAVRVAIEDALEERVRHVTRHRGSMKREAHREVEASLERYLAALNQVRAARADLIEARVTENWCQLYPSENANASIGHEANLALGLLRPVQQTLGLTHQIPAEQILQALEADASTIATRMSVEQRKELGTDEAALTPEDVAMWESDPRAKAYRKRMEERARAMARGDISREQYEALTRELRD